MSPRCPAAVMIGASAGAVEALTPAAALMFRFNNPAAILPALPPDFPRPIIVIVHVPPGRKSVLAEIFDAKCRLRALEAEDKEPLYPGTIYFAPPDYHVLIEQEGTIALSNEALVLFSRPSIDVAFESAAEVWGDTLTGIILSGANQDGARGLRAIADAGGTVIVQDPATAYSSAMPQAALHLSPEALVLPLDGIVAHLQGITR